MKLYPKALCGTRNALRNTNQEYKPIVPSATIATLQETQKQCEIPPRGTSFCSYGFKRGRGNISSNTSRGCMAKDSGAEQQKGKDEGVKRLKEMKQTI